MTMLTHHFQFVLLAKKFSTIIFSILFLIWYYLQQHLFKIDNGVWYEYVSNAWMKNMTHQDVSTAFIYRLKMKATSFHHPLILVSLFFLLWTHFTTNNDDENPCTNWGASINIILDAHGECTSSSIEQTKYKAIPHPWF